MTELPNITKKFRIFTFIYTKVYMYMPFEKINLNSKRTEARTGKDLKAYTTYSNPSKKYISNHRHNYHYLIISTTI